MHIDEYTFGKIVIDGKPFMKDVIIFPDRVFSPWWRKEGHLLQMEDLAEVLREEPDILVIGRGHSGVMEVPGDLVDTLESRGIEVIVEKTTKAVDIFNGLESERKIAAFHLTC
jgi:hypothetical protein